MQVKSDFKVGLASSGEQASQPQNIQAWHMLERHCLYFIVFGDGT